MVDMQNDLNVAFNLENELSDTESVCVNAVNQIEELEREAEAKLADMRETSQQVSTKVQEWSESIPSTGEMRDAVLNAMRITAKEG